MGRTAMVTGASSGIGEAFCRALASKGWNLVVVARSEDRLRKLCADLTAEHEVDVDVLVADLTAADELAAVEARAGDGERPIELLVNNAGIGFLGDFVSLPVDGEDAVVRLNVLALVRLCHAAAGAMGSLGRGGIINVSSIDAHVPIPLMSTYAATKAFVSSFSRALREELRPSGVVVTLVEPGVIETDFFARGSIDASWMPTFLRRSPDEVVDAALRAYDHHKARVVPNWMYRSTVAILSLTPTAVKAKSAHASMRRSHLGGARMSTTRPGGGQIR